MQRIEEYNQLLEDSKEVLRKDTTLWKGFLKFATQFTHYQFFDQILIYVQNPKATACATFDQWKKIGRYVRKGEHSIVLLDETGKQGIFAAADLLVAYNNQFDLNFLEEWGIQAIGKKQFDVMLAFAREYGEWNDFFCDYKWQKLGTAAAYYGYHFRAHDSLEDVRATLYIFDQMQHSNKRELFEDYFWEDSEDEFDEEEEW